MVLAVPELSWHCLSVLLAGIELRGFLCGMLLLLLLLLLPYAKRWLDPPRRLQESRVVGNWHAHENYLRTIGALFAVYW